VQDEVLADALPHVVQDAHAHPGGGGALHQDAQHEGCFLKER